MCDLFVTTRYYRVKETYLQIGYIVSFIILERDFMEKKYTIWKALQVALILSLALFLSLSFLFSISVCLSVCLSDKNKSSNIFYKYLKGALMQIEKALINDLLGVLNVSWKFHIPTIYNLAVIYHWNLQFS